MGSTEHDVEATQAAEIVGTAYFILHMLPADPDRAAPLLKLVEDALKSRQPQRVDGWNGAASYVLKQRLETALASLAVAAGIVENVRPQFAAVVRGA